MFYLQTWREQINQDTFSTLAIQWKRFYECQNCWQQLMYNNTTRTAKMGHIIVSVFSDAVSSS